MKKNEKNGSEACVCEAFKMRLKEMPRKTDD